MRTLSASLALVAAVGALATAAADDWTARVVARGEAIGQKVAKLRGLRIKRPIAMGVMTDDQLRARILERLAADSPPAERAAEAAMLKRWGLVPWATDLDRLTVDLLTEQIAGFYDPTEQKLYVADKPEGDDTWADMIMAHEIVHALQDQHFGLDAWMAEVEANGDASAARAALVEGDGVALMLEYTLAEQHLPPPWSTPAIIQMLTASMDPSAGGDLLAHAPLALRQGLMFPYVRGLEFVAALRRTQPWSKVDAAFRRPPRSTEQILHPERYLADELPQVITASAPAGWRALHDAVWGEAGWATFLESHGVASSTAAAAADGWGGDRLLLVAPVGAADAVAAPRRTTGLAQITFDTEVDAVEAWAALSYAVDDLAVGVEVVGAPDARQWLDTRGRVTAIERRGATITLVTGAPLARWRALVDAVGRWPSAPAKR